MQKEMTKSEINCLEGIKKDALNFSVNLHPGKHLFIQRKPSKKKIFLAKISNIGIPVFQLFIHNKLFGTFIFNNKTKEWSVEKE